MKQRIYFIGGLISLFLISMQSVYAQFGTFQLNPINGLNLDTPIETITPLPILNTNTAVSSTEEKKEVVDIDVNQNAQTSTLIQEKNTAEVEKKIETKQDTTEIDDLSAKQTIRIINPTLVTPIGTAPVDPVVLPDVNSELRTDSLTKESEMTKPVTTKIIEPTIKVDSTKQVTEPILKTEVKLPAENTDLQKPVLINVELPKEEIIKDDKDKEEDFSETAEEKMEVKESDEPVSLPKTLVSKINMGEAVFNPLVFEKVEEILQKRGKDFGISVMEDDSIHIDAAMIRKNVDMAINGLIAENIQDVEIKKPKLLSPIEPTLVKNIQDLGTYVGDIVARDKDVNDVTVDKDKIEVVYNKPAKFFGIFPTKIKEKVSVNTNAEGKVKVEVERPWWALFTNEKVSKNKVKEDVEKRIQTTGIESSSQEKSTLFASVLSAIDRTLKVSSGKVTSVPVLRVQNSGLPSINDVPEDGVMVSDLDQMVRDAFFGQVFSRPSRGSSAYLFIDVALNGMLGGVSQEQVWIVGRTAGDSGIFIVDGINRVLALFSERGLTYQRDAFLRASLVLETARAIGGDLAAANFVNQYAGQMATLFSQSGLALPVSNDGYRTIVNVPVCRSGDTSNGCVDVALLFSSLADPRSLSDLCEPGNMVLNGVLDVSGTQLYGCPPPSNFCGGLEFGQQTTVPGAINNSGIAVGQMQVGQTNSFGSPERSSFATEHGIGEQDLNQLCGAHSATSVSMGGGTQQCIADAIAQIAREDLLAATGMAGCMSGVLGLELGDDPAIDRVIDTTLSNHGCGALSDDADNVGSGRIVDLPDSDEDTESGKIIDLLPEEGVVDLPEPDGLLLDDGGNLVGAKAGSTRIMVLNDESATLGRIQYEGSTDVVIRELNQIQTYIRDYVVGHTGVVDTDKAEQITNTVALTLLELRNVKNGGGSTLEPDSDCSQAMSELQQAYTQCSEGLLDQVARGAGVPGSSPAGRVDTTIVGSNPFGGRPWQDDQAGGVTDPITACMEQNSSRTHGAGGWIANGGACGAMLCADGTDSCCAGTNIGTETAGRNLQELLDCAEIMCIDGEDCACVENGGSDDDRIPSSPFPGGDGNPIANSGVRSSNNGTGFFTRVAGAVRNFFGGGNTQPSTSNQSEGELNNSNNSGNPSNPDRP